jgi:predicted GIY-YIG superfamily endonuclease
MTCYVYAILFEKDGHQFDGLIRYVGKTSNPKRRMAHHLSYNNGALGSSIRKNGRECFSMHIMSQHESDDEAFSAEVALIASLRTTMSAIGGLNMTQGGQGVPLIGGAACRRNAACIVSLRTAERRKLKSVQQTGKKHTVETKEKMRVSALGRPVSEETKEKIRQKAIGRKVSIETRIKMSIARTGKKLDPLTDEHKKIISISRSGFRHTPETKEKMKHSHSIRKQFQEVFVTNMWGAS